MGSGDDYEGLDEGTYKCDSCGKPKFYLFKDQVKDELIGQAAYELWCKRSLPSLIIEREHRNGMERDANLI